MDEKRSALSDGELARGREAAHRSEWVQARDALSRADALTPLHADDLELLATAEYLLGNVSTAIEALQRAYQLHVDGGDIPRAVRTAFWVCFHLANSGEFGQAGGWVARGNRLLEDRHEEGIEHAYMLLPIAFQQVAVTGDYAASRETAARAAEIGRRLGDSDVVALALNVEGRALLREDRVSEGVAALDEAMLAVVSGEVTAPVAGSVYCSLIEACEEISDVGRAHEWTAALTQWCDHQRGVVTFTGQCLVHRAAIRQLHGEWTEAVEEARLAREQFVLAADKYATGAAMYRLGELHRCRGDTEAAENAYRQAGEWGHDPQPGLALLRLAQGRSEAAVAAITRAIEETTERARRAKLLPALVEILLAADDVAAAHTAADELAEISAVYDTAVLVAVASQARGAVLLAEADAGAALAPLREAAKVWRELDAPYDEARVRVLVAQACRALGDEDTAALELEATRRVFVRLGARNDLARIEMLTGIRPGPATHGLTARELEVLRLLATGRTNRAIAEELVLAVKTVDRHASSIFSKLGVSSRAAATAYAYQHGLV
jgi:DNA-binding CsgD family transcriptional regulator